MQANSGVAFAHLVGLKIDPKDAPKVHGFGWNLGLRDERRYASTFITSLISEAEMQRHANVYIERLHPIYGFLDLDNFHRKLARRWEDPHTADDYDPVLCGVASLGSLFSGNESSGHESALVECAKYTLETTSIVKSPALHDAAAWLLRTLYLRCNSLPHAAWIASCTTMHIIEATGLHQDSSAIYLVYADTADRERDLESQRRLFWLARLLNTWISYEYGRSRVILQGVSCQLPSPRNGDVTTDLISLFRISENLDPDHTSEASDLEGYLTRVNGFKFDYDALTLSQSNLALTIYRRLRIASESINKAIMDQVIRLGSIGLEAATRMADLNCPWWHVANVPFQFVCILLTIDSQESLALVQQAMMTLKYVTHHFGTKKLWKAYETAKLLVRLSQKRKEQDALALEKSLELLNSPASAWHGASRDTASTALVNDQQAAFIWPDDVSYATDMSTFDWNSFLDVPLTLFNDFIVQGSSGEKSMN